MRAVSLIVGELEGEFEKLARTLGVGRGFGGCSRRRMRAAQLLGVGRGFVGRSRQRVGAERLVVGGFGVLAR